MKTIILTLFISGGCGMLYAQVTNTFPSNGDAGIGTISPNSYGHGGTNKIVEIYNSEANANSQAHLILSTGATNSSSSIGSLTWTVPNAAAIHKGVGFIAMQTGATSTNLTPSGNMIFATRGIADVYWMERMRINENGNLGLGTINPTALLHVAGKTKIGNNIKVYSSSEAWAEGLSIIGSGWSGIRFSRNDPETGNYDGNWALGYTGYSGNDFSITSNAEGNQYNDIFHISSSTRNIGIGTSSPHDKLSVNGKIRAKEIKIEAINWPDYVFEPSYLLPDLKQIEKYIKINKHLPDIPPAIKVHQEGVNLGEMNAKLVKKIEELTLYLIDQNKEIAQLKCKVNQLESKL